MSHGLFTAIPERYRLRARWSWTSKPVEGRALTSAEE
jgi:hypothetical protein